MKTDDTIIRVTNIQRFCMHDGDGVRTTVFFKGCPLHCAWCHNPETQSFDSQISFNPVKCISCGFCEKNCPNQAHILEDKHHYFLREKCTSCGRCTVDCPTYALTSTGRDMTVTEILDIVKRDKIFYKNDGGLTVSGGEPTCQAKGLVSLLQAAKDENINTAVETCGAYPTSLVKELVPLTDLFLCDFKDGNAERLKKYTGASLSQIDANLNAIDKAGGRIVLCCLLIPTVNITKEHAEAIARRAFRLSNCQYVELLLYHPYGNSKSQQIGRTGDKVFPVPQEEEIQKFIRHLKREGVNKIKYKGTFI